MDELLKYLNSMSRRDQHEFASACNTTVAYLRNAVHYKKKLGAELSVAIEQKSNGVVTRMILHPDNFISMWPELTDPSARTKEKLCSCL